MSVEATKVYLKRSAQGVESVRGKGEITQFSPEEQKKISSMLRPIIADWIRESEAKGIPAREMLKRAGYSG